jgi:uncharacterized protein (TIGR01777 family)
VNMSDQESVAAASDRSGAAESPQVAIAGASGLIGTALANSLRESGWRIRTIGRSARSDVVWDPAAGVLPDGALQGCRAVVNLAGAGIADQRWTEQRKQIMRDSRVDSTRLIAEACAREVGQAEGAERVRVLVNASAIGYYGARGDEPLTEDAASGEGYLPEVCRAWEAATQPASAAGVRTVLPRIGVVMTPKGGALEKMLPAFRWGMGSRLGSGRQFMSWIGLGDMVRLLRFAIEHESLTGPVNATAPEPVTNADFTRTLASVLGRGTFLPVPSFAIRLMMGEMGQRILLEGQRVIPERALQAGFAFDQPALEGCLRAELRL